MTLLPGLIDCHDHLGHTGYGLMDRWELDAPASLRHLRTAQVLQDTLEMGYTSVRDAGGLDHGFQLAVEEGLIPGPRLTLSISLISPYRRSLRRSQPFGSLLSHAPVNLNLPAGVVGRTRCHSRQGTGTLPHGGDGDQVRYHRRGKFS